MSCYISDPDVIDHWGLVRGEPRPEPSLGPRSDNVIIPLDLTQLLCPGFTLAAGPPSSFSTDGVGCWGGALWRACNLTSFSRCLTGPVDYRYLFASRYKGPRFISPGGYLCETGILLLAVSRFWENMERALNLKSWIYIQVNLALETRDQLLMKKPGVKISCKLTFKDTLAWDFLEKTGLAKWIPLASWLTPLNIFDFDHKFSENALTQRCQQHCLGWLSMLLPPLSFDLALSETPLSLTESWPQYKISPECLISFFHQNCPSLYHSVSCPSNLHLSHFVFPIHSSTWSAHTIRLADCSRSS
jgi:hypothetical protein